MKEGTQFTEQPRQKREETGSWDRAPEPRVDRPCCIPRAPRGLYAVVCLVTGTSGCFQDTGSAGVLLFVRTMIL